MTFVWPLALIGLAAVPVAALALLRLARRPARYRVAFTNLDVLSRVAERRRRDVVVPPMLFGLAAAVLLTALARPEADVIVPREDATIVLVIDASASMEATDIQPSRLEAARAAARSFVRRVPHAFRLGVIGFSDVPDVLAPPTADRTVVMGALSTLEPGGGTAIGDALGKALALMQRDAPPAGRPLHAVLLLSDGASTTGSDPLTAAERARRAGVPVFTIALGAEGTAASPLASPPDRDTLRAIASATRARYFSAPSEGDLARVYADLGSRLGFERQRREITFAFGAIGAVLLATAVVASQRRRGLLP